MMIRKNKKRIDPRYFLNETALREEDISSQVERAMRLYNNAAKVSNLPEMIAQAKMIKERFYDVAPDVVKYADVLLEVLYKVKDAVREEQSLGSWGNESPSNVRKKLYKKVLNGGLGDFADQRAGYLHSELEKYFKEQN